METAIASAVGFLLENVVQLIKENQDLLSGAESKVTELSKNLELLKSFVTRYTKENFQDDILKELAKQIRALIHEAEDAIEEYIYYVSLQKSKGKLDKAFNVVNYKRNVLAVSQKIEDISERVEKMYCKNYVVSEGALKLDQLVHGGSIAKKPKAGVPVVDKVIGFEDAATEVIERLTRKKMNQQTILGSEQHKTGLKHMTEVEKKIELEQNSEFEELEVVSIVGMFGLGKTTLARKVLVDSAIEYEFFTRIFVAVSNEYDKREVLQDILVQGNFFKNNKKLKRKSIDQLEKLIHKNLKKKYLIVLDDVWTKEAWDDLKPVFPNNNNGSRVLITTRDMSVAEYSRSKIKPYKLRFLYPNERQELLRTKVFDENVCPQHLKEIEKSILGQCTGQPLEIVVTAGILRNNREEKEWWDKVSRGVSASHLVNDDQKRSNLLIKMSYDQLPYQLKPCFLYLGVFPEDVEIPVWKLIRLWIAEGFIQQAPKTCLEEIAEEYLRELVDKNLVTVGERTLNDQIKTCRVHDTLRHFCKKMAIEENLFQEVTGSDDATNSSSSRRLCVNTCVSDYISGKPITPNLRSFLSFPKDKITLQKGSRSLIFKSFKRGSRSLIFKSFKLLRVLDIISIKLLGRFPAELPNLVLLKYIAISCELKKLPRKMSSLLNLQTIIIDTTSGTLDVQLDLWKMTHLRHLHTNASTTLPKSLGQSSMVNLQTLSTISPKSCIPELFDRTQKLKKLGIRGKLRPFVQPNGESSLFDSLLQLEFLENLKLQNDDILYQLRTLPFPHKFPAKLKKLCLQGTRLDWAQMSGLGKLKFLEVLKLKDNAFKGKHWETEDGGFLSLKVLFIGATDLTVWKAKASNFPELKCLVLKHCCNLKAIPSDFVNVKSLQMIDLEHTSRSVVTSVQNMQLLQLRVLRQKNDFETNELMVKIYPPE